LKGDAKLGGTVAVGFIIGMDGSVESVKHSGGTITNQAMIECVLARYRSLCFPQPTGGKVMVTCPIEFSND